VGDTAMAEALRGSEVRYRRLFEAAQYGILILDSLTGLITDANPYLIGLLNCSHEEFVRKAFW
jgi:PAS domain-containing protein